MRARKIIFVLMAALLCAFLLYFLFSSPIKLIEDDSYFSSYSIKDGKVYISCQLVIDSRRTCDVEIIGFLDREAGKLLKDAVIIGYDTNLESNNFHLERGTNTISVIFIGDQGSTDKKLDRLLPDKIEIIPQ